MGESGIKVHSNKFLRNVRRICNEKKILLILDEVQCGIGRSGKFFAYEYANVKPDIVPIAKGIGGGFPIGAVLMTKKVSKCMIPGTHGSTYGGNPLAMVIGNTIMDQVFKKGSLIHAWQIKQEDKAIHSVRQGVLTGRRREATLNLIGRLNTFLAPDFRVVSLAASH